MRTYIEDIEQLVESKLNGSFLLMFLGLIVTFLMVFLVIPKNGVFFSLLYKNYTLLSVLFIVLVFSMNFLINKLNQAALILFFMVYSAFMGVLLFPIIIIYSLNSVYSALLGTAISFLIMAFIGYITKANLHSLGKYLFATLIGIIVASLLNIFFRNSMLDAIISIIALIVFLAYTAYDTWIIKNNIIQAYIMGEKDLVKKIQVIGALNLYMDFINIFIRLLQLTGRRRD